MMVCNVWGNRTIIDFRAGGTVDDLSSIAQADFWGALLEASQQPFVVAWFALGAFILVASAVWVSVAKRKATKNLSKSMVPRTIAGSSAVAEIPIARSA